MTKVGSSPASASTLVTRLVVVVPVQVRRVSSLPAKEYVATVGTGTAGLLAALESRERDAALIDLNYTRDTTSGKEGLDLLSQIRGLDSGWKAGLSRGFHSAFDPIIRFLRPISPLAWLPLGLAGPAVPGRCPAAGARG